MEGHHRKRAGDSLGFGVLIFLLLVCPSFAQSPANGSGSFDLKKLEVSPTPGGSRVIIEGSRPFEYTVFKSTQPSRVVVELPGANLGKLAGSIEVGDGVINVIRNKAAEDSGQRSARVEIGLVQAAEHHVTSEGSRLYIDLERKSSAASTAAGERQREKPAVPARTLKDIEIAAKPEWVEVKVKTDGLLPEYRSFQLTRPTRLVVDLPQMRNAYSRKNLDVGSRWLKEIRIGQHPQKIRLVFVFPESKIPPYRMEKEGKDLKVVLGRAEAPVPPPPSSSEASVPPRAEVRSSPAAAASVVSQRSEAQPQPAPSPATPFLRTAETKAPAKPAPTAIAAAPPPTKAPESTPGAATPEAGNQNEIKTPEVKVAPERASLSSYKGARISLDFKDADIHNIFRLIAEVSNLNIITSDDVKGRITIRLVNVPWDQALDVILSAKNLIKIEEGNVIRITTLENVRKEMEEKAKEEAGLIKSMENRENAEELVTETFRLNYAKAMDLQKVILGGATGGAAAAKPLLSARGSVRADERTNTLIIRDIRSRLEGISLLVKKLDSPTPQVLIEARVIQAATNFTRSLGVQWGGSFNQTGGGRWAWGLTGNDPTAAPGWGFNPATGTNLIMPSNFIVNFPASTSDTQVGGLGISFGKLTGNLVNLDLRIQLGETEGQTRVIARPKLATLDNIKAHIKQGELIPYETTSQAGTQVQFIDAVLLLEVTPQVTPDGGINMTVKITRDARGTFRSPLNQVPSIDKREAETKVLVKDGETVVIGGIYESESVETETGIPWLRKVPILGWLFKRQQVSSNRRELLIFITPSILQLKAQS